MAYWIENYIAALCISVLLTGLIIPKVLLIAFRRRLFDTVDDRKIHHGAVPRLGGIAFLPALGFSISMVIGINLRVDPWMIVGSMADAMIPIFFFCCALMLIYLVGLTDDLIGVRYRAKFIIQVVVSGLIIMSGLWIKNLYGFLWINSIPEWFGWILTILLIVFVVNAINLIDGIDGLASGLSAVALIWFSYVFYLANDYVFLLLAGATLGTLAPFFYFNVFGKASSHTKIFMGDTGSLTIGLILVFLTLRIFNIGEIDFGGGENVFIIATAPLIVPCFDVVRVFIHRVRKGRNPFMPDKCHIHHKLLALGLRQWHALILIVLTDMAFIVLNVLFTRVISVMVLFFSNILLWTLLNILLTRMIRRREVKLDTQLYE